MLGYMLSRGIRRSALLVALVWLTLSSPVAAAARKHPPLVNLTVLVTDHATHKPVFQAHLTLQFRDPHSRFGKVISYSAKTDLQGEYKFSFIPMEAVYLIVTASRHQTLGKTFQVTQDNQVISVELRRPQPLR